MHEVDMTKCLILSMEEWAEKKNKEKIVVEKINLKIGEFTCVEPISLINTFNAAVLGSWLDSSEITIETIPFEGKCSKCNRSYFPKKENGYKSPCCNFNLEEIISGRELKSHLLILKKSKKLGSRIKTYFQK